MVTTHAKIDGQEMRISEAVLIVTIWKRAPLRQPHASAGRHWQLLSLATL